MSQTLYLFSGDGFPLFAAIVTSVESHSVEFTVKQVGGWNEGRPTEPIYDDGDGNLVSEAAAPSYLRALIKWDGCSHVYFGEEGGYVHICGAESWANHCKLMEWLYKEAIKLMPQLGDESPWPAQT